MWQGAHHSNNQRLRPIEHLDAETTCSDNSHDGGTQALSFATLALLRRNAMHHRAFLLLWVIASNVEAQDCALASKAGTPVFLRQLPKGFKRISATKNGLRQTLRLPDKTDVTVTFRGCERIQYSIEISAVAVKAVGAEVVATVKRVLPTLPMAKDSLVEPTVFLRAIEESSFTSLPATLSCAQGTCRIEVLPAPSSSTKVVDRPDAPGRLVLTYDATP
jgi:hypothetical protein